MASDGSQKLPPKAYDYMSYMPGCGDIYAADSAPSSTAAVAPAAAPRDRIGTWFGQAPTGKGVGLEAYVEEDNKTDTTTTTNSRAVDTGPRSLILVDTREHQKGQLRHLPKVGCSIESAEDLAEVRRCLEAMTSSRKNGVLFDIEAGMVADILSIRSADDFVAVRFPNSHGDGDLASFVASFPQLPDMVVVDLSLFPAAHDALSKSVLVAVSLGSPSDAQTVASQLPLWRSQAKTPAALVGSFGIAHNCRALLGLCRRSGVAIIAEKPGEEEKEKISSSDPILRICRSASVQPLEAYHRWQIQRGAATILALSTCKETSTMTDSTLFAFSLSTREKDAVDAIAK